MSAKTSSSLTPGQATPALVGNHVFVDAYSISDSAIPIARPQAHAIVSEVSRAKRAAARAGTTRNGKRGRVERRHRAGEDPEGAEHEAGEDRVRERQLVRRQPREAGGDVVLRRRPRREPEARPAVERPEHERHRHDHAAEDEGGKRHGRIEHADDPDRDDRRLGMLRGAEREEHRRLRREEDAERRDELRERRGGAERPVDRELDDHGDEHDERVGQRDRDRRADREAELTGPERPEREAREHGDRARGQVDEPGAAVRDDDADGDGGDRRPGPEAEQEEEEYFVHVALVRVATTGPAR